MVDQGPKFVPAVQNAARILRLLASCGTSLGTTQIARETGLNVSSVFNILRTLSHEGMLSFDPQAKTYRIGIGLLEFAAPLLGANPTDLIRPLLTEIAHEHKVLIVLYEVTENERIVLTDRFAAPNIIQAVIPLGSRFPVFAGAIGRCYAARLDLDEKAVRAGYESVQWQVPPGFDTYWKDVATARENGYARDRGQLTRGIEIVSSLVLDAGGTPRLGMSCINLATQIDDETLERVGKDLASASKKIESALFGKVPNTVTTKG